MPLYKDFSNIKAQLYLWKHDDNEDYDSKELLEPENFEKVSGYHPKKLLEMLMVRKILHEKLPGYKILYEGRRPYLYPRDYEISITNSFPYAALAISHQKVGIDIEKFNPKIIRIKDKFLNSEERDFIPESEAMEYLTIIWSVKESLYKIHHSQYWSLKKHYEVKPFCKENLHSIHCRVHDENFSDEFYARVEFFDDYVFSIVD